MDKESTSKAVLDPIKDEGESITDEALREIYRITAGYPYFLQEWGFQAWKVADASPIDLSDVKKATASALKRLDEGFFQVRFDRLTPKERESFL